MMQNLKAIHFVDLFGVSPHGALTQMPVLVDQRPLEHRGKPNKELKKKGCTLDCGLVVSMSNCLMTLRGQWFESCFTRTNWTIFLPCQRKSNQK